MRLTGCTLDQLLAGRDAAPGSLTVARGWCAQEERDDKRGV